MADAYNAKPLHLYQQYNKSSAPMRFVNHHDLDDPLWDSADDRTHACWNVYRLMGHRLLEIMLQRIKSKQQYRCSVSMLVYSIVSNKSMEKTRLNLTLF